MLAGVFPNDHAVDDKMHAYAKCWGNVSRGSQDAFDAGETRQLGFYHHCVVFFYMYMLLLKPVMYYVLRLHRTFDLCECFIVLKVDVDHTLLPDARKLNAQLASSRSVSARCASGT